MLSSKQLIEISGISRATLNNYVSLGILPAPIIKTPSESEGRATRLGYFDEAAAQRIKQVQLLKRKGMSMAQIARELGQPLPTEADLSQSPDSAEIIPRNSGESPQDERFTSNTAPSSDAAQGSLRKPPLPGLNQTLSFDISIGDLPGPAYMVNNNFELIWWNSNAQHSFFNYNQELPTDLESRNLLKMLFSTESGTNADRMSELLRPHLAAGKKRLSQQALMKVYSALNSNQLSLLKDLYDEVEPVGREPMIHFPAMLADSSGELSPHDLYICFYREGIFFTYSPVVL